MDLYLHSYIYLHGTGKLYLHFNSINNSRDLLPQLCFQLFLQPKLISLINTFLTLIPFLQSDLLNTPTWLTFISMWIISLATFSSTLNTHSKTFYFQITHNQDSNRHFDYFEYGIIFIYLCRMQIKVTFILKMWMPKNLLLIVTIFLIFSKFLTGANTQTVK